MRCWNLNISMVEWTSDPNQIDLLLMKGFCAAIPVCISNHMSHRSRAKSIFIFFTNQIWAVLGEYFRPRHSSIAWDHLYQTNLYRDICKHQVDPFFEVCYNHRDHVLLYINLVRMIQKASSNIFSAAFCFSDRKLVFFKSKYHDTMI